MDTPYLNCDGCRTSLGRAGCPTHRQNASVTIAPSVQWSSNEPVLTHCVHGLDLRTNQRCYLCRPWPDDSPVFRTDELLTIRRWVDALGSINHDTGRRIVKADVLDVIDEAIRAITGRPAKAYREDTDA